MNSPDNNDIFVCFGFISKKLDKNLLIIKLTSVLSIFKFFKIFYRYDNIKFLHIKIFIYYY